jgi:hypothetical protein
MATTSAPADSRASSSSCGSCQRISFPSFYAARGTATTISTQIVAFQVLLKDGDLFDGFKGITVRDQEDVVRQVILAIVDEATSLSMTASLTHLCVGIAAAMVILYLTDHFAARFKKDARETLFEVHAQARRRSSYHADKKHSGGIYRDVKKLYTATF